MRQSVMSWNMNFEFGNVDILESVLAVMDQLKDDKPELESPNEEEENEEIFDFRKSVRLFPTFSPIPIISANTTNNATTKRNDEPILPGHDDQRGANLRPSALRCHCNYSTNGDDLRKNPQPNQSSTK